MANKKPQTRGPIVLDFPIDGKAEINVGRLSHVITYARSGNSKCTVPFEGDLFHDKRNIASQYLQRVNSLMFSGIDSLKMKRTSVSQSELFIDYQLAWLFADFMAKEGDCRFYTERDGSELDTLYYADTFPSQLVVYGTNIANAPDMWANFHVGYCTLSELRIGMMWKFRGKEDRKYNFTHKDAEILLLLVSKVEDILREMNTLLQQEGIKHDDLAGVGFWRMYLVNELTAKAIAMNSNPDGNWQFYQIFGPLEHLQKIDWTAICTYHRNVL